MGTLHEKSRPIEEVLERIIDRGIVLDGLSSLAAVSSKRDQPIHATAFCPIQDEPKTPASLAYPPRKRAR